MFCVLKFVFNFECNKFNKVNCDYKNNFMCALLKNENRAKEI